VVVVVAAVVVVVAAAVVVVVVVVAAAVVVVAAESAAESAAAAATPAAAELELSDNATNKAAPTIPIATAVPADIPPAAPADSDCEKPVTGDKPIITDSINVYNLFFIVSSLETL
jgi:hypothetical protein